MSRKHPRKQKPSESERKRRELQRYHDKLRNLPSNQKTERDVELQRELEQALSNINLKTKKRRRG